ncbi:hypothetical protein MQX03_15530 [Chryseobacterium aahli]|uniref:hypothetical protein n=1 Tax=Chryseobacterium aahli TaxID=1278643 RepID=UPI001F61A2B2|nr:hypothetical protein [Chryseobacterium aahli]MCI3938610.1 hypothetical protein [Chryseobacterium aahli]
MKKIFISTVLFISANVFSQVAIGKSMVTNNSVSLEFGTGNKGLVLPWTNAASNSAPFITGYTGSEIIVDGTLIFDSSDKKVKYKKSGSWVDISVDTNGAVDITLQTSKTDLPGAKVAIGTSSATDTTPGILVLTDIDKAMILPKVALPHLNIKNPTTGMIAYDTTNRQLAVYNGTNWTFWKP